jgi:hypothetical protein
VAVDIAPAMDGQLILEVFNNLIEALISTTLFSLLQRSFYQLSDHNRLVLLAKSSNGVSSMKSLPLDRSTFLPCGL